MSKSEKNAFFSKPFNGLILIFWNLILYTFLCTEIKKFTIVHFFSPDACSRPKGPLQKGSQIILEWPLLPGSLQLVCANIWLCWDTCLKERRGGEVKCLYQRNRMLTTFQTTASKSIGMTIMGNEEIYISYSRDKNQATSHEISHDREFLLL